LRVGIVREFFACLIVALFGAAPALPPTLRNSRVVTAPFGLRR